MGAGVAGQVDEDLVGTEQVRQVGPVGQVPAPLAGLVAAGNVLAALGGDEVDAGLVEHVVVGIRAAVGALGAEAGQDAGQGQRSQAFLGDVEAGEQGVGDLVAGEHTMVGEPAEQDQVPAGQPGLQAQDVIGHRQPPGSGDVPRGRPQEGSVAAARPELSGWVSCAVRCW